jgi:polysaccharide deacetylase 2 family uncharacterized protein YibQ
MVKRRRPRGRKGSWISFMLSFLLGAAVAAGVYFLLIQKGPSPQREFFQEISLVDQIVKSQLYETGLSKKDVLLQQSSVKREGALTWNQSVIKIRLPRPLSLPRIESNLKQHLTALGKPFSVEASWREGVLLLDVKVRGHLTHQLTFIPPATTALKGAPRARVALVIDDLGADNHVSQELLQWDLPLTLSILPFEPHSKSLALEAHQKGKEVILHLPMEPHTYPKTKPGKGAILHNMDTEKILDQLSKDIEAVPYIKGVSNHMGSRLMEDPEKMRIILSELKRRGLYFLDSRTTPQTVGLQTAQALGLASTERDVFLDHVVEEEAITQSLERLAQEALIRGRAIGVGHPHPATLRALKRMVPKIQEKGIEIVPLSALLE